MSVRNTLHWWVKTARSFLPDEPWRRRHRRWLESIDQVLEARDVPVAVTQRLAKLREMAVRLGSITRLGDTEMVLRMDWAISRSAPLWKWVVILKSGIKLRRAPGYSLLRAAEFLCARRTVDLVFRPLLSDVEIEYFEALSEGMTWKARVIRVRGFLQFGAAALAILPRWVLRLLILLIGGRS